MADETPAGSGHSPLPAATATITEVERHIVGTEDQVLQIVEETARIEKRQVETRTRVHVTVSEHDEAIEAMLMHQDVVVDRVPMNTAIDAVPPVRREGDVVIVPVMEEVLVVEKRLVLKEELHIRIDVTKRPETQTVRLRREHAEIVRDDAVPGVTP